MRLSALVAEVPDKRGDVPGFPALSEIWDVEP